MCHNPEEQRRHQMENCLRNGMPQKAVKTVEYQVKKRLKAIKRLDSQESKAETTMKQQQQEEQEQSMMQQLQLLQQLQCDEQPLSLSRVAIAKNSIIEGGTAAMQDNKSKTSLLSSAARQCDDNENQDTINSGCACSGSGSSNRNNSSQNSSQNSSRSSSISGESVLGLNEPLLAETKTNTAIYSDAELTLSTQQNDSSASPSLAVVARAAAASNIKIHKMCGRFRQATNSAVRHNSLSSAGAEQPEDAIAAGTQMTKRLMIKLCNIVLQMQSTKLYTILTSTTQPTHLAAIFIFSVVILSVWPELIESSRYAKSHSNFQHVELHENAPRRSNTFATIVYLLSFAIHFGAQIWMTFVSGLSLYFSLPRHTFGQCQQILFPKYFALNAFLSICMLIVFIKYFVSWSLASSLQIGTLAFSAFIEVTVRLYLAPPMLRLMQEKYKIEGSIGSGQEVGTILQGDLAQCPHYQRIHKTFRRIHMTIAIGNIVILLCSCLHLYYLASKIQIN